MSDQGEIDRISGLPDELIVHILSLLPSTKHRLRTSLISQRWRRLCSAAPVLDFPAADFPISGDYAAAVDRCLLLSSAQSLRRLFVDDIAPPPSYDRWIRFAASRSVLDLALAFQSSINPLPPSLFLCSKSLSSLKLTRCKFPPLPPDFLGFPILKTLHLTSVDVSDESMAVLLSCCPHLEALHLCYCDKLSSLDISSYPNPCLEHLSLLWINGPVIVAAPHLRFLNFDGDVSRLEVRDVPNLHAAQIVSYVGSNKDRRGWMLLASAFLDVKVLAVSCWFFEYMLREDGFSLDDHPPMMKNLKELRWFGVCITDKNLRALVFCLRECPVLEELCIHLDYSEELNNVVFQQEVLMNAASEYDLYFDPYDTSYSNSQGDGSLQPCKSWGHPLECGCDELFLLHIEGHAHMLSRLKAVTVTQFSNHSFGMQLIGFILRKAVVLELLQLTIMSDDKLELELLRKQLYGFSIASPHVQIEVSEVPGGDQPRDYKVYQHL